MKAVKQSYRSGHTYVSISAPNNRKTPIYVGQVADGEVINHMTMTRTKMEDRQLCEGQRTSKIS